MSDTDDTDSLLSVSKPNNLKNFLGLTVEEMSTHLSNLHDGQSQTGNREDRATENMPSRIAEIKSEGDGDDLSDSDGENHDDDAKSETGSEASTASTSSITMLRTPSGNSFAHRESKVVPEEILEVQPSTAISHIAKPGNFVPLNEKNAVLLEQQILEFSYDKHKSPTYGVRVSPGFGSQGLDFLRPSPRSGWRYLPGSENEAQIYTRVPNFRTPGGYKPPINPTPPRDLSDVEIQEEVRRMYAFPEEGSEQNEGGITASNVTNDKQAIDDRNSEKKPSMTEIESEIVTEDSKTDHVDVNVPPDCVDNVNKMAGGDVVGAGKCVKRKMRPHAAGDSVGSIPDLGFGLRDLSKLPVKEPPMVSTSAWVTGSNQSSGHNERYHDEDNRGKISPASQSQRSNETHVEISPVRAAYLEKNVGGGEISRCLPRVKHSSKGSPSKPNKAVNLLELDLLWREIQQTKVCMEEDIRKSSECLKALSASCGFEPPASADQSNSRGVNKVSFDKTSVTIPPEGNSGNQNRSRKLKSILKSKNDLNSTDADLSTLGDESFDASNATDASLSNALTSLSLDSALPSDLDTLDLSGILSAAHLKSSEFEDILSKLGDCADDVTWEEINGADDEIESVITNMEVTDWAKSGAKEYLQKYHDEKLKRQHCESEISSLQNTILKLKEEAVLRERTSAKKDAVLLKMTKAWSEVTKQWKAHEAKSKYLLEKLQNNQVILSTSLRQSKERIEDYERELSNSVELAGSFKAKLEVLEVSNAEAVEKLKDENTGLKTMFTELEVTLDSIKAEKDTAIRALGESQKQLDEKLEAHRELREKLMTVENEIHQHQKEFEIVTLKNHDLQESLHVVAEKKEQLEEELVEVTQKLRIEEEEKERLESTFMQEVERQVKEESDRLHAYYNSKLQEALHLHAQQVIATEARIIDEHRKQLQRIESDAIKKCREYKQKCLLDMTKMIHRHEKELKTLRHDLAQKEGFISTVSAQLHCYEKKDKHRGEGVATDPRKYFVSELLGRSSTDRKFIFQGREVENESPANDMVSSDKSSREDSDASTPVPFVARALEIEDCNSSIGGSYPLKLPRYNTSTPNSASKHGEYDNWKDFAPIRGLFSKLNNANTSSVQEQSVVRKDVSGLSSVVTDNLNESPIKLSKDRDLPSFSVLTEQSLMKLVQTLDKCSSERKRFPRGKEASERSNSYAYTPEPEKGCNSTPQKIPFPEKDEVTVGDLRKDSGANGEGQKAESCRKNSSKPPWK